MKMIRDIAITVYCSIMTAQTVYTHYQVWMVRKHAQRSVDLMMSEIMKGIM